MDAPQFKIKQYPRTKQCSVHLPPEALDRLRAFCEKRNTTIQSALLVAVHEMIEHYGKGGGK